MHRVIACAVVLSLLLGFLASPALADGTLTSPSVAGFQNSSGATVPIVGDKQFQVSAVTATTTLVVAASAGKSIYITAFLAVLVSGTSPYWQLEYGTQTSTPCDTGATVITPGFTAVGVYALGNGAGVVAQTTASQQLCLVTGGTTPVVNLFVRYAQF